MKRVIFAIVLAVCSVSIGSATDHHFRFAYVANPGSNTVAVIDRGTNTVVDTIAVGNQPEAVAVTPDGRQVWVVAAAEIDVIETARDKVAASIPFNQNGNQAFPNSVIFSPDCRLAYVVNAQIGPSFGFGGVLVIDRATYAILDTIQVGNDARSIAITPNGRRLYVTNAADGTVSVIDTKTNTVLDTIGGPGTAQVPAVTPNGEYVYVVFGDLDAVLVIDTASDAVKATIQWNTLTSCSAFGVAIAPDGRRAYVTCTESNNISVIDTATNTIVNTIPLNESPFAVAVGPYGRRLYVTDEFVTPADNVSVIDTLNDTVVAAIPVSSGAGIAVRPLP